MSAGISISEYFDKDLVTEDIYGISRWGDGLITVLENGHIGLCQPQTPDSIPTDLTEIIKNLDQRGITAPVLLRVTNFLRSRIDQINISFNAAIDELAYKGKYRGVFPVKVNQQAPVVDRIVEFGRAYDFGLEVGSKAELLIALSHNLSKEAAIICNGIKDSEFVRLALMAQKLGYNCFLVLESPRELDLVLDVAKETGVIPQLGIRVKLTYTVSGNWAKSSGDRSTFGLVFHRSWMLLKNFASITRLIGWSCNTRIWAVRYLTLLKSVTPHRKRLGFLLNCNARAHH